MYLKKDLEFWAMVQKPNKYKLDADRGRKILFGFILCSILKFLYGFRALII